MKGSIALVLASSVAVEAYNKQELVLQDPAKIGEVSISGLTISSTLLCVKMILPYLHNARSMFMRNPPINYYFLISFLSPSQHVITKRPHEFLSQEDLPASLDYRDSGLLTMDLNQHIPLYCGSCWAHSAFSSIADRLKIQAKGKKRDIIPSIQALINCGDAGTCQGGDSNAANAWVHRNGIPDWSCQQYQGINMECNAMNMCMNCDHDTGNCYEINDYPQITVEEYGTARGDHEIMAEIYARGPVSAYIDATCIETYTGGINNYDTCSGIINHAIQLNGWGTEDGVDYWIGRNSWWAHMHLNYELFS